MAPNDRHRVGGGLVYAAGAAPVYCSRLVCDLPFRARRADRRYRAARWHGQYEAVLPAHGGTIVSLLCVVGRADGRDAVSFSSFVVADDARPGTQSVACGRGAV